MKSILFSFASLYLWLATPQKDNELFKKIESEETISKKDLKKLLPFNLENYEERFFPIGVMFSSKNLQSAIIQGVKNDTTYDILIVYKDQKFVTIRENPESCIYRRGGAKVKGYMLGQTYIDAREDTGCFKAFFEKFIPFRVDTLKMMFSPKLSTLQTIDSLKFCER